MVRQLRLAVAASVLVGLVGLVSSQTASASTGTVVKLHKTSYGKVLAGPDGRSLYILTADRRNASHCNSGCRIFWPPLKTSGKPRAGTGINAAKLGQTANHQVTYYGKPLYYYKQDSSAGQTNGEGVHSFGGYWYLVNAKGKNQLPSSSGSGYPY